MKHSEFKVGMLFRSGDQEWLVTDMGSRTVVAICMNKSDSSWYRGPPYSVPEIVFDEYDQEGCGPLVEMTVEEEG